MSLATHICQRCRCLPAHTLKFAGDRDQFGVHAEGDPLKFIVMESESYYLPNHIAIKV